MFRAKPKPALRRRWLPVRTREPNYPTEFFQDDTYREQAVPEEDPETPAETDWYDPEENTALHATSGEAHALRELTLLEQGLAPRTPEAMNYYVEKFPDQTANANLDRLCLAMERWTQLGKHLKERMDRHERVALMREVSTTMAHRSSWMMT